MTTQPTRRATRVPTPTDESDTTEAKPKFTKINHGAHEALDFAPAVDPDENRAALEAAIDEKLGIDLPREGFEITDEGQASWAARKLAAYEREIAERNATAKVEIARIVEWAEDANAGAARGAEFFRGALEFYLRSVNAADPSKKSVKLPHADLTSRAGSIKWDVADDEKLIEWLDECGLEDCFSVVKAVKLAELKKALVVEGTEAGVTDDTGFHAAPGVTVTENDRTFAVKARV